MRLQGKVAIVTGAGSGNGRAIALRLAEDGADIACADVNAATAQEAAEAVRKLGRRALALSTDVSQKAQVEEMVARTVAELGRLDIMVANAGIISPSPFLEMTEETWDKVLAVNLKGTFLCGQAAAREMAKGNKGGVIVNVGSITAEVGMPMIANYATSKGGVRTLTKTMATELAQFRIRVNAIAPGFIDTPMIGPFTQQIQDLFGPRIPWGRIGRPSASDVATVAAFLASDESEYVTGSIIFTDGGLTAA